MTNPTFIHDVFLSYSNKDKTVVHALAERLRDDGLRVWLDEWEIRPGDSIPANAFGSNWGQLESYTFRIHDPLNKERRFLPLRLDKTPIKGSLKQFLTINWLPRNSKKEYLNLLEACLPPAKLLTEEGEIV